MQPWIRAHEAHAQHGAEATAPALVDEARPGDDGWPDVDWATETVPIVLQALTYGRHAAPVGRGAQTSTRIPARPADRPIDQPAGALRVTRYGADRRTARSVAVRLRGWALKRSAAGPR